MFSQLNDGKRCKCDPPSSDVIELSIMLTFFLSRIEMPIDVNSVDLMPVVVLWFHVISSALPCNLYNSSKILIETLDWPIRLSTRTAMFDRCDHSFVFYIPHSVLASSHVFIQSVNFYLSFCCVCIGVVICIVVHLRYTLHYVLFAPEKSPAFMAMHTAVPLRVQNYISCAKLFFCLNSSPLLTTFTSHQTMQAPPRSKHCIKGYHQIIIN